jgi:hypothetical protein
VKKLLSICDTPISVIVDPDAVEKLGPNSSRVPARLSAFWRDGGHTLAATP